MPSVCTAWKTNLEDNHGKIAAASLACSLTDEEAPNEIVTTEERDSLSDARSVSNIAAATRIRGNGTGGLKFKSASCDCKQVLVNSAQKLNSVENQVLLLAAVTNCLSSSIEN